MGATSRITTLLDSTGAATTEYTDHVKNTLVNLDPMSPEAFCQHLNIPWLVSQRKRLDPILPQTTTPFTQSDTYPRPLRLQVYNFLTFLSNRFPKLQMEVGVKTGNSKF